MPAKFEIMSKNLTLALKDMHDGIASIYIWPMLGWQEIKQRYRRSMLGPLWLTISTGAMIAGMGPLYGRLFNQDISTYFPYLATSLVVWQLIAGLINDCCNAFIAAEGYIKQIKLPLSIHVLRVVWRNLIVFGHNLLIVALVLAWYQPGSLRDLPIAVVGIGLVALNGFWLGILLGLLCARFRDIPQIVTSLVQVALFLTPVMWHASMLGKYIWAAEINPLYHFLEIVRAPLLGQHPELLTWYAVIGITVAGYAVTLLVFSRFRARIAYWV